MTDEIRKDIIAAALEMNRLGLNQGTSGNISVRSGAAMLLTPTAVPYDRLTPEMLPSMDLGAQDSAWTDRARPRASGASTATFCWRDPMSAPSCIAMRPTRQCSRCCG